VDIKDARIGQRVRGCGMEGKIIKLNTGNPSGFITIVDDFNEVGFDHAALFEPIAPDACESCPKIPSMNGSLEYWQTQCHSARRDAAYWREELDKLQKEALAECKPLGEVAKIYIQISPSVLAQIMGEE
jgi:hypothetical protein